jgi:Flp pilus assembly protein TadD
MRIDPGYALAYNNRGYTYEQIGNREQAIVDYRKALELDNDPEATRLAQENLERLGEE